MLEIHIRQEGMGLIRHVFFYSIYLVHAQFFLSRSLRISLQSTWLC